MIDRKEFGKKKKILEEQVKLRLILKYTHIHQLYQSGEISLKEAYDIHFQDIHLMKVQYSIVNTKSC